MKNFKFIISFIILLVTCNFAAEPDSLNSVENDTTSLTHPSNYLPLLFDPGLTMQSGAENIVTIHKGFTLVEDKIIGTQWFSESNILSKTGAILSRFAKYSIIDLPLDYFSVVLAHEYFGHGARYRELKIENIDYGFNAPPPYGNGSGHASANIKSGSISEHELISIWIGGMEVHSLINQKLSMRWIGKKEINYREASLYLWSTQIMFNYIQSSKEDLDSDISDNDPRAYVRLLNRNAGYTDLDNLAMTVGDLKSQSVISLVNPFIYYSIYTFLKTYLWDGDNSSDFPSLSFGEVEYLPALRLGLTPFGTEYHLENYLKYSNLVSMVDLSIGDQTFYESWGSIGIYIQNIYQNENLSLDTDLHIWNQPEINIGKNSPDVSGNQIGGAVSIRGYYDFRELEFPISLVLEMGYKTKGFLEGFNLDSAPILMFGIAININE
ncbi:hypothetical protein ACFLS9_01350 [Bacteroidota bacterium]